MRSREVTRSVRADPFLLLCLTGSPSSQTPSREVALGTVAHAQSKEGTASSDVNAKNKQAQPQQLGAGGPF